MGSILEAAHINGLKTGLVVTSRITHATPASYSAHVLDRDSENEIAAQQIGYTHPIGPIVDILIGGGRRHYLPADKGGNREDGVNLIDWAVKQGYTYASDKGEIEESLENGKLPLPFLGLLADSHLDYEMDRNPEEQPSLQKNVETGLKTLAAHTKDCDKGFFLMVEASRIDHAGHANDAAAHVHETLMFNEVMAYLKEYVAHHPDTQLLSAADHECGGLTLEDGYNPTVLTQAQNSGEQLAELFDKEAGDDKAGYLRSQMPLYGLNNVTDEEISDFIAVYEESDALTMAAEITNVFAAEAGLNWSTGGHTAADVQLHGFSADGKDVSFMRHTLGGNVNNIELPRYVERALGVSMEKATEELRKDGVDWVQRRDMLHIIKRDNMLAKKHAHHD